MNIPMVDPAGEYRSLKAEIDEAFDRWDEQHPGLTRQMPSAKSVARDMFFDICHSKQLMTFVNILHGRYPFRLMNDALDPLAIARQPTQQRARARFDSILAEAERLLIEQGLAGFSIPLLAERLGYTRGSVYAYFPTPYAILNELVLRYLVELEGEFFARTEKLRKLNWSEGIEAVVDIAVERKLVAAMKEGTPRPLTQIASRRRSRKASVTYNDAAAISLSSQFTSRSQSSVAAQARSRCITSAPS